MERHSLAWKVRADRRPVSVEGTAEREDGSEVRLLVSNLTYDGCLVVSSADLRIAEMLRLQLPVIGEVRAQVRWAQLDHAGLRFVLGA